MLTAFQTDAVNRLKMDDRIRAMLVAGSFAAGCADRFSDLDLIVVADDAAYLDVMAEREAIAAGLGELIASFTGEHVGEPRLLICLYAVSTGDRLLHVDLKFVRSDDLADRVDDPVVLWDRDGRCAATLASRAAVWPERSAQWFEDRVWVWLHYGAARLARGERYEALSTVNWIRDQVLGPMLARQAGRPQRGLRHIEAIDSADDILAPTAASSEAGDLWMALGSVRDAYLKLRKGHPPERLCAEAEMRVNGYIDQLNNVGTDT